MDSDEYEAPSFDPEYVDEAEVAERVAAIGAAVPRGGPARRADLLIALRALDLTRLEPADTPLQIRALCRKALRGVGDPPTRVAAVCVLAKHGAVALKELRGSGVRVALVAGDFPRIERSFDHRVHDVLDAAALGPDEIDVVIDPAVIAAHPQHPGKVFSEIHAFETVARPARLKAILGTGMMSSLKDVARASWQAVDSGADFLKTSTGKDPVNATLEAGVVMSRQIRHYCKGRKTRIGLKAAGGIRTADEALAWVALVRQELGEEWLTPDLFRIGASALLESLEKELSALS